MAGMRRKPEVRCRQICSGGDNVPTCSPSGYVVERGEQPGQVVGLVVGRRSGRDQTEMRGRQGDRGEQRDGLQARGSVVPHILTQRRPVGEEHRVELRRLSRTTELLVVGHVVDPIGRTVRVAPRGLVMTGRIDERVEAELTPPPCHVAALSIVALQWSVAIRARFRSSHHQLTMGDPKWPSPTVASIESRRGYRRKIDRVGLPEVRRYLRDTTFGPRRADVHRAGSSPPPVVVML